MIAAVVIWTEGAPQPKRAAPVLDRHRATAAHTRGYGAPVLVVTPHVPGEWPQSGNLDQIYNPSAEEATAGVSTHNAPKRVRTERLAR